MKSVKVKDVVFRDDLYPRINTSPETVQKYAANLDVLPPIEVNQHTELIDGWHRWTAFKKEQRADIPITVTQTKSDAHLLELAIERNAAHGLQLSQADKKDMAVRIYASCPIKERDKTKVRLAKLLSVSDRTLRDWLQRTDKEAKDRRDREIFSMWMACFTQQDIANQVGCDKDTVSEVCRKMADLPKSDKSAAEHATDFKPPIYNEWKQQTKSDGVGHYGNSETRWVDNLLYLYTKPFDVVLDPFAGSGSTIDVCWKRFRRHFVSDRKPIVERESDILEHDLVKDGKVILPKPPQWKDVKLVYLDPPYWKQAAGKYSKDPSDLANMDLETFTKMLASIVSSFGRKLTGAYIALIISPTQWAAPDRQFTDHVGDMLRAVKLPVDMRFSVPYESQQYNGNQVEWAKENKRTLVLTRELIVWRKE